MRFKNRSSLAFVGLFQLVLLLAALVTIFFTTAPTQAGGGNAAPTTQLVIQLNVGIDVKAINQAYGTTLVRSLKTPNTYIVTVRAGLNIQTILAALTTDTRLVYAESNYQASLTEGAQISAWADQGSALQNGGGTPQALSLARNQWAFQQINLVNAQQLSQGANLIIAVLDTGVNASHSDLTSKLLAGYNVISNSANANDDSGHGTFVAGLLAQVAPAARIMPIKVLDNTGRGTVADAADGLRYAADRGAKIINVSLGVYNDSKTLKDAVSYAQKKGAMVVASAGNDNTNQVRYPAAYSEVVAVAATDQLKQKASFSNYGKEVTLSAPGVQLYSTYWLGGYAYGSGTSFATPQVAGEAALIWALHPELKAKDVSARLSSSATSLKLLDNIYGSQLGKGLINSYQGCLVSK